MPKNPTGFIVDKYSLSEIANIKALDKTYKKVERPHSKIEYKNKIQLTPKTTQLICLIIRKNND